MAGYRFPGPVCGEEQPGSLRDGTLTLWRTPPPGPVCASSSLVKSIAPKRTNAVPDLSFLFRQCLNPVMGISDDDFKSAAAALGVDVPTIRAVAEVETSGNAFDGFRRPRILFERHYFHRFTSGRHAAKHARISAKSAGGYGKFSAQYGKLEEAYALDPDAALRSASWGRFQIMGSNFRAAGFASVQDFVRAMTFSEAAHLQAFVGFVSSNTAMAEALRKKDWAAFAKAYNGAGYKKNSYDAKLRAAYDRFSKEATSPPAPVNLDPNLMP
jgi:hypothetical protein